MLQRDVAGHVETTSNGDQMATSSSDVAETSLCSVAIPLQKGYVCTIRTLQWDVAGHVKTPSHGDQMVTPSSNVAATSLCNVANPSQ